ncbi:unnamed protein product, partial [Iphiclides podalirius]
MSTALVSPIYLSRTAPLPFLPGEVRRIVTRVNDVSTCGRELFPNAREYSVNRSINEKEFCHDTIREFVATARNANGARYRVATSPDDLRSVFTFRNQNWGAGGIPIGDNSFGDRNIQESKTD